MLCIKEMNPLKKCNRGAESRAWSGASGRTRRPPSGQTGSTAAQLRSPAASPRERLGVPAVDTLPRTVLTLYNFRLYIQNLNFYKNNCIRFQINVTILFHCATSIPTTDGMPILCA